METGSLEERDIKLEVSFCTVLDYAPYVLFLEI